MATFILEFRWAMYNGVMFFAIALMMVWLASLSVTVEWLGNRKVLRPEVARKAVHVGVAVGFAAVALAIGLAPIWWLAVGYIAIVVCAEKLNMFAGVRRVGRRSWGEYFFLVGVAISSLVTSSKWVFAAAVLTLGFADTMAALIGKRFGQHVFKIAGQKKSLEGSLSFMVVAVFVITGCLQLSDMSVPSLPLAAILVAFGATILEAGAPFGADNILIPVYVSLVLELLARSVWAL